MDDDHKQEWLAKQYRAEDEARVASLGGPNPPGDNLYVLAGDYQQAAFFANEKRVSRDNLRYTRDPHDLHGIDGRGRTLYCFGAAWRQKRYREILDAAIHRGFEVKHV